jgi:hypothetical protein
MLAVLHFIGDDDDPLGIVSRLRTAMAPGSYLAISHVTADFDTDSRVRDAGAVYEKATYQITLRSRAEVARLPLTSRRPQAASETLLAFEPRDA